MKHFPISALLLLFACGKKQETIKPTVQSITESIYASGSIASKNQYQAFATVSGIVNEIFVSEGDSVDVGSPLLSVANEAQHINKENARLSAEFSDVSANQGKLKDAKLLIDFAKSKMQIDSAMWQRQQQLWAQKIGTQIELEQRELAYKNAKTNYLSATEKYGELKRQIDFSAAQSKNTLNILNSQESDFTLRSRIKGLVYGLNIKKGEIISPQMPLAVLGDRSNFILEMQVDEYDIVKIKKGLPVMVSLNSHKDQTFEATVTKINPLMKTQTKTFLVEAEFNAPQQNIYPNVSFEANILLNKKENAVLIPRSFLLNDSLVVKKNGEKTPVKTGLKDYQMVEILSGIGKEDELIKPVL